MRLKGKFRPNLGDPANRARVRRVSGTSESGPAVKRIRTVSSSSNHSAGIMSPGGFNLTSPPYNPENVVVPLKSPPPIVRIAEHPILNEVVGPNQHLKSQDLAKSVSAVKRPSTTAASTSPENVDPLPMSSPPTTPGRTSTNMISPPATPSRTSTNTRQRRLTESRDQPQQHGPLVPASVFDRRRADHKRKFTGGVVPERTKMTMFDLIYYNPLTGSRMSTSSSRRTSRASRSSEDLESNKSESRLSETLEKVKERLQEEAVDDIQEEPEEQVENEEDEIDEKMPVPQVKVGPNGEIIIDEESTIIETNAAKKAKEDLLKSPLIFENANNQSANYGTWSKKRKSTDWSKRETVRFFKALSVFGTDFSMMESIFKKRSRQELKLKFKKEERQNRALVDRCLREGMQFDVSVFHSDSEDEIEEEKRMAKIKRRKSSQSSTGSEKKKDKETAAKKGPKKRVRKVVGTRGYYSSSDADESSLASDTDSRRASQDKKKSNNENSLLKSLLDRVASPTKAVTSNESPLSSSSAATNAAAPSTTADVCTPNGQIIEERTEMYTPENNLAFPPGLLAANPGLANAVPGSLVVVASPADNDPQQQMLHVFRVQDNNSATTSNSTVEKCNIEEEIPAPDS